MVHCKANTKRRRIEGFTLVELMVTLSVIAILAVVAVPSMGWMANASRLSGSADDMVTLLQMARSEAVRRNAQVQVCASSNGTSCSGATTWTRVIAHGRDLAASGAPDEVLRDATLPAKVQIAGPAAGIVFRPSGVIDAETTITICVPTSTPPENQRVLTIMVSGVIKVANANGGGAC